MGTEATNGVSTSDSGQTHLGDDGLVPYIVQVKEHVGREPEDMREGWFDVATVRVVPRTKKRTVIEKGLAEAGIEKTADLEARLLDEHAAYVWRAKPPEPAALRLT
jgi:hypothetical protein